MSYESISDWFIYEIFKYILHLLRNILFISNDNMILLNKWWWNWEFWIDYNVTYFYWHRWKRMSCDLYIMLEEISTDEIHDHRDYYKICNISLTL